MCLIPRVAIGGMRRGSLFPKQVMARHIFVLLSAFGLFVCLHAFGVSLPIDFFFVFEVFGIRNVFMRTCDL